MLFEPKFCRLVLTFSAFNHFRNLDFKVGYCILDLITYANNFIASRWRTMENISIWLQHTAQNGVISPNFLVSLSTKFPHKEIRWNYGILRSDSFFLQRSMPLHTDGNTVLLSWKSCQNCFELSLFNGSKFWNSLSSWKSLFFLNIDLENFFLPGKCTSQKRIWFIFV